MDSLDDDANYVHIDDVKDGATYYCPCCKGVIKPRAYKEDIDYKVQPHFYHASGGCSPETYVHYICKTWLFDIGSKFIVGNTEYCVAHIDTEKTFHTSYGDYRPDMTIETIDGKLFYVEIKSTNKKSRDLVPKWDELGNDVVEIDVREVINQKYRCDTPTFKQIYSDGECFIKSYSHSDYDRLIEPRKKIWKRQEKINYKIQWEHLDWFWSSLSSFLMGDTKIENVIDAFDAMDIEDRLWCYQNIKGKSCMDIKQELAENINLYYIQKIYDLQNIDNNIRISVVKTSPLIHTIYMRYNIPFDDYQCHITWSEKVKEKNRLFLCDTDKINRITEQISLLSNVAHDYIIQINHIKELTELPYIASIHPKSHQIAEKYDIYFVPFVVKYIDHIHNKYIYETIGVKEYYIFQTNIKTLQRTPSITESILKNDYKMFKNNAIQNLELEIQSYVLRHISALKNFIDSLQDPEGYQLLYHKNKIICKEPDKYSNNFYENEIIFALDDKTNLQTVYKTIFDKIYYKNRKMCLLKSVMKKYMDRINRCNNGIWHMDNEGSGYYISMLASNNVVDQAYLEITEPYSKVSIEKQLHDVMKIMASGLYSDIRLLEVDNGKQS